MAATVTNKIVQQAVSFGNLRARIVDVTLDSSYVTGGYAVTPAQVSLAEIYGATVLGNDAAATTSPVAIWNQSTGKLQAFVSNGASPALLNEAPGTTNLAAVVVRVMFIGV
jgi:hypothetical protein